MSVYFWGYSAFTFGDNRGFRFFFVFVDFLFLVAGGFSFLFFPKGPFRTKNSTAPESVVF